MKVVGSDTLQPYLSLFLYLCRNEGGRGFYKGLLPNLLRVTPATAITFVVYENVSHWLRKMKDAPTTDAKTTSTS